MLALDGLANLTCNGSCVSSDSLIGVAYADMTVTAVGNVSAVQDVTLIVDEYAGASFGGSSFTNNGGISSSANNIAIYAASGLQPPVGFTVAANLMTPGNLVGIETWDQTKPEGLIYKYDTSWDAGGPFHGPGFGTVYTPGTGVFGSQVVWYKVIPTSGSTPTPFVFPPRIFGIAAEVYQVISLLSNFRRWGQETSFAIQWEESSKRTRGWKEGFSEKHYLLIDDTKREHRVQEIYERMTRRKYL
ncbi:MAG: hypothetical protein HYZ48_04790 [Chlamydiales bacterium]|nr:hypothetical protein [Chlamydiales bacterium]